VAKGFSAAFGEARKDIRRELENRACNGKPRFTNMMAERGWGMAKDKTNGLKSAFDLAMERMAQRGEQMVQLSEEQKQAIAEIARRTKAKVAEIEIMYGKKLAEARAANDEEKAQKIEEEQRAEINKIKARAEEETNQARKSE
jgi:hypothetical protein